MGDYKKVRDFLTELDDVGFRYMKIQVSMGTDARNMMEEFNLSKEQFCELAKIDISDFQSYINGGYDYTVLNMAIMHTVWIDLRKQQAEKEVAEKLTNVATEISK